MALRNKMRGNGTKIGPSEGFMNQAPSYSPLSTAQMNQMGQMGQMVGQMNNNLGINLNSGVSGSISQRQHMATMSSLQAQSLGQGQIPGQVLSLQGQGPSGLYSPLGNLTQSGIMGHIPGNSLFLLKTLSNKIFIRNKI